MADNLKPCPFCGGKAIHIATSTCSGYIYCSACDMATAKFWDEPMNKAEESRRKWKEIAEEAWNRRAEDERTDR